MMGILCGSMFAALFTVTVLCLAKKDFSHSKVVDMILFSILLIVGNMIFNPVFQSITIKQGYCIGLIAALIYLISCTMYNIVKDVFTSVLFKSSQEDEPW